MGMIVRIFHEMVGTRIPHSPSLESGKQSPGLGPDLLKESGSSVRDDRPAKQSQNKSRVELGAAQSRLNSNSLPLVN